MHLEVNASDMTRLAIVIAEGVQHDLLRRLAGQGALPWWQQAIASGSYFPLDCGPVPYEPSNLATALTGVGPGHHGCFSYWAIHEGEPPAVLRSTDVRAPRLWAWPALADLRFAIVNVQLTHPPQPLNGCMVSYLMQQSLHATYPPTLRGWLAERGVRTAHDVSAFYRGGPLDSFAAEVTRIASFQVDTAVALAGEADVLIANVTLPDRLSHFLWHELEPGASEEGGDSEPWIVRGYRFVDAALRRLEASLEDRCPILVFSEIGFGPLDGFVSVDAALRGRGLQKVSDGGAVDLDGSLAREAVQGSHGINLVIPRAATVAERRRWRGYERSVEELCAILPDLRDEEGRKVIASAKPSEEVYDGPWTALAPDIIVEPSDPRRPPLGDRRWADHVRRDLQTGWHRAEGFGLLVNGPPLDRGSGVAGVARLEQIAATACRLLGRDPPAYCRALPLVA